MVESMQKRHSQDLPWNRIYNRQVIAIFSGKCFMLAELMETDIHPDIMEDIVDSMFEQSAHVLGYQ